MTKLLVSCAISRLYMRMLSVDLMKNNISLMSLLGARHINICKNVVSIIQQKYL